MLWLLRDDMKKNLFDWRRRSLQNNIQLHTVSGVLSAFKSKSHITAQKLKRTCNHHSITLSQLNFRHIDLSSFCELCINFTCFGANESDNSWTCFMFHRAYLQLGFYSLCGISMRAYSVHCPVCYLNSSTVGLVMVKVTEVQLRLQYNR